MPSRSNKNIIKYKNVSKEFIKAISFIEEDIENFLNK